MIINADLHVHGKYSMATSKNMTPKTMAHEAQKKGLNLIATGDALHSKWLRLLEETLIPYNDTGIYTTENTKTKFITTVEVEDNQRIHHLIIIPSIETAWQMRDEFKAKDIDADGRPKLRMNAQEIMDITLRYDCMIGPAHIFTPWTGIYKSYDTIRECYDARPDFVELGLSSDTYLADAIKELHDYTYLTNSDSHSPWPHRMGREFNRIEVEKLSYKSLYMAIKNNTITENYGINPNMGKYHETGCTRCYRIYTIREAQKRNMKCTCGGRIKKGVKARIDELATPEKKNPENRPPYRYILPLAQLLSTLYNRGITTKYVQTRYDTLIREHDNEIEVLINTPISQIKKDDRELAKVIESYRTNSLEIEPGRGGQYGKIRLKKENEKD